MSGRIGNLNDKQAEKLTQFKETLKAVLQEQHDDIYLLRFLKAREFDLKKSEFMFRKVLQKYWGGGVIGYDKDGAPVWVDPSGRRDVKVLLKSCKGSDVLKFWLQRAEMMMALIDKQNKKLGKDVGGVIYIGDLEGMGGQFFWKPWTDMGKKLTGVMEQHYPETLKKSIIINAPKLFSVLYAMMKPLLRETRKKLIVLGSDWKTELVKYVDASVLPAYLGGTRVDSDGDPMCHSVVNWAGKVPESFYLEGQDISERNLTTRVVPQAGTLEFKYEVKRPGSVLSYEFKTKEADIGFSVKRVNTDGSKVDIVGKDRYHCHISPEEGQQSLEEPGTYVVKFDNSYSFTRSKTISYFLELLEPLANEEPEFEEQKDIEDFSAFD